MESKDRLKLYRKLMERLRTGWIFVEGQKDKRALKALGLERILTISGNLRLSCERLAEEEKPGVVYVLTDLDRRGDELAVRARKELEARSIRADLEVRKGLAYVLNIRNFEDARKAYEKMMDGTV